jgi:hypothetical protein
MLHKFKFCCLCGAHWAGTLPYDKLRALSECWDAEHKPGTDANGEYHCPTTAAKCRAARYRAEAKAVRP